ncbi:MAG: hypothetical protein AAF372_04605, partial [Pseudomonadota bacterium]
IEIDQAWTDLVSQLPEISFTRNEIAACLIDDILDTLVKFESNQLNNLNNEWQKWDVMNNKTIAVYTENNIKEGIARGVDDQGNLLLESDAGEVEHIAMGEISIRPVQ